MYDKKTALIVVDVQNDFADPSGSLYVPGGEDILGFVNEQIRLADERGATVVYTQDWHPASTPHFEKDGGIWPVHCVGGTTGAEFHPGLVLAEAALYIKKGTGGEDGYSAFNIRDPMTGEGSPTGLARTLAERGVERVAVAGLALDYCVKESALDASAEGFATLLLADGTRAVNVEPGDGTRAAAALAVAGVEVI